MHCSKPERLGVDMVGLTLIPVSQGRADENVADFYSKYLVRRLPYKGYRKPRLRQALRGDFPARLYYFP